MVTIRIDIFYLKGLNPNPSWVCQKPNSDRIPVGAGRYSRKEAEEKVNQLKQRGLVPNVKGELTVEEIGDAA